MTATIAAVPSQRSHPTVARTAFLTLALGATVVISWVAVRGPGIINGPGPWLDSSWLTAWTIQALLAFGGMVALEWLRPSASRRAMVTTILAAWVGELCAAIAFVSLFVGELDVVHAPYVWLVGTGFGIQPAAALLGGTMARRGRRPPSRPVVR